MKDAIRGTDWQRHEENIAKARQSDKSLWDIGVGEQFKLAFPDYVEKVRTIYDAVDDGLSICLVDGRNVYVYLDSTRQRAEIALREDAVKLWGEKNVSQFDSQILGK